MEINWSSIAQMSYEAYIRQLRLNDPPKFETLPERIKNAWIAAVKEVADVTGRIATA